MEHIVQFGVTIDDDKIENMIMEQASRECLKSVKDSMNEFTKQSYYSDSSKLETMFKDEVKKIVSENKDLIISEVVKQVSTNLMKTKDMIAAKARLVDSLNGEEA